MRRLLALGTTLFLALPAVALAASETTGEEEKFNPASEWTLHEWVADPPRADRHVDQQGRRLPAARQRSSRA